MPAPLALYLHYPWCIAKCPYCDFNSHERKSKDHSAVYIERLIEDIRHSRAWTQGGPLTSVYFGGGTPSLMQPREVAEVLGVVDREYGLPGEITLEANPGTFERARFKGFRSAGISRLSVGVQSFQDDKLRALGRVHDAQEAARAVSSAVQIFDRVNLDIMYGLPGQSVEDALFDLDRALSLGAGHLSWYQLTIEPRTLFHRRPPLLPVERESLDMEVAGLEKLAGAGLRRYEISAFAAENEVCRHNLNYWQFGDYLGIGAGAHGKLMRAGAGESVQIRTRFARQPRIYMGDVGDGRDRYIEDAIPEASMPVEFMMNALRLIDGVEAPLFEARTGVPLARIQNTLDLLRGQGLLRGEKLACTPSGLKLLDSVVAEFLP